MENKYPDFIYIPDIRIAGHRDEVDKFLSEHGYMVGDYHIYDIDNIPTDSRYIEEVAEARLRR